MISNSKTIKKKIPKLFSRDLITEFVTQTQFRWHKPNINISEPTTTTKKKKKGFCIGELESTATTKKESNSMNERERMTYLIEWGPPPNA